MRFEIIKESHLDHGLTPESIEWLRDAVSARLISPGGFVHVFELTLDEGLPPVSCALHGPVMGDAPIGEVECFYVHRGDRKWTTRSCRREPRDTRHVTVIVGPHEDKPCVLYTAFGGPKAPREPDDPDIDNLDELASSRMFWREHALSRAVSP